MANAKTSGLARLETAVKAVGKMTTSIKDLKAERGASGAKPARVFGITKGESPLASRGFSYVRLITALCSPDHREKAKSELAWTKHLTDCYREMGYFAQPGIGGSTQQRCVLPFATELMPSDLPRVGELRKELSAGVDGVDPDEVRWLRKQAGGTFTKTAQSWLSDTLGGTLVPQPMQGELIEFLRNKNAIMRAGARVIGMPPMGRIVFPAQTAATTAYAVGESVAVTESNVATGHLTLTAKKLGVLARIPNELVMFSSPAADALIREDMALQLDLGMDNQLLQGVGTDTTPKGLINYSSINSYTATQTGSNGDTFNPQDGYRMVGKVEDANAMFNEASGAFIFRPNHWRAVQSRRASAATAGDEAGQFISQITRSMEGSMGVDTYAGFRVVRSAQVPVDRVKNSGTTLTLVLFGDWSQYIIASNGVIEFLANPYDATGFAADQIVLRGILRYDGAPRHQQSFCLCDTLING